MRLYGSGTSNNFKAEKLPYLSNLAPLVRRVSGAQIPPIETGRKLGPKPEQKETQPCDS
jgi:hypothetical protein